MDTEDIKDQQQGIVLPCININGTSANTLFNDYLGAKHAVDNARSILANVEFHARDYMQQPNGGEIYRQARAEHTARLQKLVDISNELGQIIEHVYNSGKVTP